MYSIGDVNVIAGLVPNGNASAQDLTVSSTAVSFAALHADTTHVMFTVDNAVVRVTFAGDDPTAATGHPMPKYANGYWSRATGEAARFIRDGDSDGVVHITEMVLP